MPHLTWPHGLLDRLRASFWFLPSVMAAGAAVLSFAAIHVDAGLDAEAVRKFGWIYTFGPEGARALLSTVASSMITVAGLTFSITMLTLQLASTQYGPRLLRNVMRDRGTQMVLGTFVGTFVYCLLVLRTVRGTEGASNVPHLSVAFGVLLALASLGVLIYFIHHVAHTLRLETVLAQLAAEANESIDHLYPEQVGRGARAAGQEEALGAVPPPSSTRSIAAPSTGYVQRLDAAVLMRLACKHDVFLQVRARPGRFVRAGDAIVSASPTEHVTDATADALATAFTIGPERSPEQDLTHSLGRIVEIAQRALSPGVNDPTTALYCLDRVSEVLHRLAGREVPSPVRCDEQGVPRVRTEAHSLDDVACPALAAVARYGLTDAAVIARVLELIDELQQEAGAAASSDLKRLENSIRKDAAQRMDLGFDKDGLALRAGA